MINNNTVKLIEKRNSIKEDYLYLMDKMHTEDFAKNVTVYESELIERQIDAMKTYIDCIDKRLKLHGEYCEEMMF